jgi:hypothetical protein
MRGVEDISHLIKMSIECQISRFVQYALNILPNTTQREIKTALLIRIFLQNWHDTLPPILDEIQLVFHRC